MKIIQLMLETTTVQTILIVAVGYPYYNEINQ